MKKRLAVLFLIYSLSHGSLYAQQASRQLWFEYMLTFPFANSFSMENAVNYSTVLSDPKWRTYDYAPTLEWSAGKHFDLIAQTTLSYTNQTESYNTFEVRPAIGTRVSFTPNKRIQTRLLLRVEQRNFKNLETKEWDQVIRPRVRGEMIIPINKNSYFQDKLWYALTDVEWFFTTDDVNERFANRFRWRVGAGYRLSYSLRFEFLYMMQQSKDAIDGDFESSDHIFRFRVKQYLRKSKPTATGGVGN